MSIGNWSMGISNWGSNLNWLLVDVSPSSNLLMDIWLSFNLGINIGLSSNFLMDVWLSSWVEVSISNRGIINSSISSSNRGSSISYWLSSICTSNGGYWLSSGISIRVWISIAIIGSWDDSS